MKAAKIALDGVRQEADVGSRTILDILDAEQELFTANVNLVTAQRNEVIAIYNVKSIMGELTADNLNLPGPHYDMDSYRDKVKYRMIGF